MDILQASACGPRCCLCVCDSDGHVVPALSVLALFFSLGTNKLGLWDQPMTAQNAVQHYTVHTHNPPPIVYDSKYTPPQTHTNPRTVIGAVVVSTTE